MIYRKLRKYKYQILEDVSIETTETLPFVITEWIEINNNVITIFEKYCWDGASCAIDTKTFMEASLVHDALYQLIRTEWIDKKYRIVADRILKDICLKKGMSKIRANYVYWAVRTFGGKHIKIGEPQDIIYEC